MSKLKGIRGLIFQLAILCLSFFYAPLLAQESYAERLIQDLSTAKEDTTKVYFLNELAWELKHTSLDSARLLLTQAYDLAEKLNYLKGKGDAMNYRGVTEDIHGNSKEAINYFERALEIRKELNDLAGQASLYNNIGNLEESLGDNYGAALRNYELSRRIRLELKDDRRANNALYNMGIVYESMGDYVEGLNSILLYLSNLSENDSTEIANGNNIAGNIKSEMDRFEEALAHYQKAETIHKELGNQWEYAGAVLNVGNMYDAIAEYRMDKDSLQGVENYYQKAIEKYEESLVLVADLEDEAGRSETLNNLGTTYKNLGSYYTKINKKAEAKKIWKQALSYAEEALYLRENNDEKKGLIDVYNTIGDIKRRQNKLYEARRYTELCLKLSQEIKDVKSEHNAYKDLARINFSLGNYQKAYVFREKYDQLKYSRLDEKRIQSEERRMVKYTKNLQVEETKKAEAELFLKQQELELKEARLARESTFRNSAIGGALALALLAFLLYNRNRIKNRANENLLQKNEIIEAEKQRAESLLLNILPAATAAELKENGKARARSYKSVSVLFTDFKSFTQIAEQLSPEDLVAELDTCFQAFDDILTRHNIEKIKTIGDAYMCAGGLPLENDTHPTDVVKAALEMRDFMKKHRIAQRTAGKPEFRMRIGIHTGSVVAGVVGNKKFAYDIWGDAVNLAARMENSGEVGKVNISQQTYELVKNEFACTHRGKISAKNKGEVDMYFVEEKRLSL